MSAIAGFSLLATGAKRFALARQHMALGADEVLRTDPRSAILYLRSFSQDDQTAPGDPAEPAHTFRLADRAFLPGFWLNRRHLTFEELLCKAMQRIAPVVAIGRPGEPLPRLGAARKYVADHSWRAEVLRLIEITRFTCLIAGVSKGLRWEFKAVMSQGDPSKILLIVPQGDRAPYFWQTFVKNIGEEIGEGILPESMPNDMLALLFRHDWRPVVVTGRPTVGNYRKIAKLTGRHARVPKS